LPTIFHCRLVEIDRMFGPLGEFALPFRGR